MEERKKMQKTILMVCLIALSIFMLIPFYWMVISSFKMNKDVFSIPMKWWPDKFQWNNYKIIWKKIPLFTYFMNTAKLTIITTAIQLFTSIRLYQGKICGKRSHLPYVCNHHCHSVAGIYDSPVYPGFQNGS